MKVFGSIILALGAFQSASAFVPQGPAFTRAVSLSESRGAPAPYYAGSTQAQNQNQNQNQGGDRYTAALSGGAPSAQRAPAPQRERANEPRKATSSQQAVKVQGGSLKTWALRSTAIERVQIVLNTEGRPLDADIDLWHGPDNTPHKMRVYLEDGSKRPFNAVVETPRGPNTVAVRNIGQMEFPLDAFVLPNPQDNAMSASATPSYRPKTIQGGALKTFPFESNVDSVQILLRTDGRPLNAKIELLQGPNNVKQVLEIYIEDGMDRPFFLVIETPGSGNVIRILNTSTVEFPMSASVEPYSIGNPTDEGDIVVSGDNDGFSRVGL